jgi:hypothetical protein
VASKVCSVRKSVFELAFKSRQTGLTFVLDELFCVCAELLHSKWVRSAGSSIMGFGLIFESTLQDLEEALSSGPVTSVEQIREELRSRM